MNNSLIAVIILLALAVILLIVLLSLKKKPARVACPCGCCDAPSITTLVGVDGMSCGHCTSRVEAAFSELGYSAKADLETKIVTVLSDAPLDEAEIRSMIENLGFVPTSFERKE